MLKIVDNYKWEITAPYQTMGIMSCEMIEVAKSEPSGLILHNKPKMFQETQYIPETRISQEGKRVLKSPNENLAPPLHAKIFTGNLELEWNTT